jgi:hypothetical protein
MKSSCHFLFDHFGIPTLQDSTQFSSFSFSNLLLKVKVKFKFTLQSFSGPSPLGLATIFYCLRFETSLFVASYDSQGYVGGVKPRFQTVRSPSYRLSLYGLGTDLQKTNIARQNSWRGQYRKHNFLYCCEGMITMMIPGNRGPISCLCVAGMCLATRCLAMVIHVTI